MRTVQVWTGQEAKALRLALRLSIRDFASHLGVASRTIDKWEAKLGGTIPRPEMQAVLDTALRQASDEVRTRFEGMAHGTVSDEPTTPAVVAVEELVANPAVQNGLLSEIVLVQVRVEGRDVLVPVSRRLLLEGGMGAVLSALLLGDNAFISIPAIHPNPGRAVLPLMLDALPATSWAASICDAVLNPTDAACRATTAVGLGSDDVHALRHVVDRAIQVSLSSGHAELERLLPNLIGRAESVRMQMGSGDHSTTLRLLSDVYAVAGWTLIKADGAVGAWVAAQRAVQAAEHADDVLRLAAATRCLAEVHMRARNFEEATRTALLAAVYLDSAPAKDEATALSLRGAAMLSAAAASARGGDGRGAKAALKAAAKCADAVGEDRSDLGTVFGPTNVAIHQVAVAVELGNAREAIQHIPAVKLNRMPSALTERRARFLIDVARSYAYVKDDAAVVDALVQADTIAPDELRSHRLTRELVQRLLRRERRTSELRALADRCNLLD